MVLNSHIINIKDKLLNHFSSIEPNPVFILGNHKSGTTAIAALLAEATQFPVTLDLKRAIHDEALQLRLKYGLQSFQSFLKDYRIEFSRKIIKEPILTIFSKELLNHFPDARFVYIVRDPRDNIRSILNRLRIPGNKREINIYNYTEIKKTIVWALAFNTSWLHQISTGYIDALSQKWNIFCDYFDVERHCLVRYEDFKEDKEKTIYELAKRLQLEPRCSIVDKVEIQYQTKGSGEVNWIDFFGESNLIHIERVCRNRMQKFGYPSTML